MTSENGGAVGMSQGASTARGASDTAHETWNAAWSSEAGRADWIVPEPDVLAVLTPLRMRGASRALDLGCGVGRHALAMAALGFETVALDASPNGLGELGREAARRSLSVETVQGRMDELPFPDGRFDFVLAWNVIYHGDPSLVRRTVDEIARVLAPGGCYCGTMLSKRRADFGAGTEIAPDTFVNPQAGGDKGHPHFFCDAAGLVGLFDAFEVMELRDVDAQGDGTSWHWHVVAARRVSGRHGAERRVGLSD